MGLMTGKNVVIFGVANKRSIAWGIAQALHREGAKLAFAYQNDRMGDSVKKLAAEFDEPPFMHACDVAVDGDIERFYEALGKEWDGIDGLVHSIAFAKREELGGNFVDTSWEGYALAQQVSAWSLIGLVKGALPMMEGRDASVVCLSYYGAEKVVPGYNIMGVAKSCLESTSRYLAAELGERNIRVNTISGGYLRTLASSAVGGADDIEKHNSTRAPLRRNVEGDEVGKTAVYLASDLSSGVTGENIYVDCGVNTIGV